MLLADIGCRAHLIAKVYPYRTGFYKTGKVKK